MLGLIFVSFGPFNILPKTNPPISVEIHTIIINKKLPKEYLYSIKKGIDCYICLSYMEGFCIPLLDAVVLKKDIITLDTKISGYRDFINKDNSILFEKYFYPSLAK